MTTGELFKSSEQYKQTGWGKGRSCVQQAGEDQEEVQTKSKGPKTCRQE